MFLAMYLLFWWGLALLGIKLFWLFYAGVPLGETARNVDFFYGQIRQSGVLTTRPRHRDEFFDVLLLGGSVLTPEWGDVQKCLAEHLQEEFGDRFRVYNLAYPGHTSRDSLQRRLSRRLPAAAIRCY